MMEMLEKMKYGAKKDKLRDLIKLMNDRLMDDDEDEDVAHGLVDKPTVEGMQVEVEMGPRKQEKSEEELLEEMGQHESEEVEEDEERHGKDIDMLDELKSFMKAHSSKPEALKGKKTRVLLDSPLNVPQSTQSRYKSGTDNFDAKMSKKKKLRMKLG